MKYLSIILIIIIPALTAAQTKIDDEINTAYQNAKKGIYWALSNIPEQKNRLNNELVADDKLYCKVKLDKKINGVKIQSTGYFDTNQVTIIIYKSYDTLIEEGFIKKKTEIQ